MGAGLLVTLSNGAVVPADTPAIAAAKAAFRKAGGVTDPAASVGAAAAGLVSSLTNAPYSGPVAAPGPLVTHSNGAVTPADTPAVAAAKAAFAKAGGVTNPSAVGAAAAALLVTLSNGAVVPADTPAIAAAKAKFRAAGGNT